jgi:hypothetical protein
LDDLTVLCYIVCHIKVSHFVYGAHSMVVTVVSETQQEYDGKVYWLCGSYYQRHGKRLHRVVWAKTQGMPVPRGYDVHHIDGNRANNEPENLTLLTRAEHMSHHHKGRRKQFPPEALLAAAVWHRSDAGKAWHSEHGRASALSPKLQKSFVCEHCGKCFVTKNMGHNRFCSNACKTRWRYAAGLDNELRRCMSCGKSFVCNKYNRTKTCSKACSGKLSGDTRRKR